MTTIGVVMAKTGLVPTKIGTFGIEFEPGERTLLLKVFAGVILYFLLTFVLYSLSDFMTWQAGLFDAFEERHSRRGLRVPVAPVTPIADRPGAAAIIFARGMLDFLLPVPLAIYAVLVLLN